MKQNYHLQLGAFALSFIFASSIYAGEPGVLELSSTTLAPYDYAASEQNYRLANGNLPKTVTAEDFSGVTNAETAARLVDVGTLVYRHYVWANRAPRFPAPPEYANVFSASKPGLCDSATRMVHQLLGNKITSESFNLLVPLPIAPDPAIAGMNFKHSGHTVARVKLERGSAIIDVTYGLALITTEQDFDNKIFSSKNFKMFSLFDRPSDPTGPLSPYAGQQFYEQASADPTFVGPTESPITARMPTVRVPAQRSVHIGTRDGTDKDVALAFGGYANHIGFWYEPTRHVWSFEPEKYGPLRITFHLLGGDNIVLKTPLDIDINTIGVDVLAIERNTEGDVGRHITFSLNVRGPFSLEFSSKTISARLVDAIVIEH